MYPNVLTFSHADLLSQVFVDPYWIGIHFDQ